MGNLRSVEKAFHHVGATGAFITSDPEVIRNSDKAVLPGDGAFDATMDQLRSAGVNNAVKAFVKSNRPFLGICVGMQVLFSRSDEGRQGVVGLQIVPGNVRRFDIARELKVPQIGWNELSYPRPSRLFVGMPDRAMVYFLHSFYCEPDDESVTTATCDYGISYCAGLEQGNVYATQFHPEKSGEVGLTILKNFAAL
jgi:glutamine amidotransferase